MMLFFLHFVVYQNTGFKWNIIYSFVSETSESFYFTKYFYCYSVFVFAKIFIELYFKILWAIIVVVRGGPYRHSKNRRGPISHYRNFGDGKKYELLCCLHFWAVPLLDNFGFYCSLTIGDRRSGRPIESRRSYFQSGVSSLKSLP